ncbi:MAG: hypothetical protein ACMUIM_00495 [bacterium]
MSNNKGRLFGFALLFTGITCFLLCITIPLSNAQFTAPGITGAAPYLGVPYQGIGFGAPISAPPGYAPQYPGIAPYAPGFTNYSGSSAFTAPNAAYNTGFNQIGFPGTGIYNPGMYGGLPMMTQPGFAPLGLNTAAPGLMNPGLINPLAGAFGMPISPFQPFAQQINPFMPFVQQVNPFMPFGQQMNPFMPFQQQYNPFMPFQQQYNPFMPFQQQQWNPWNPWSPYSNTGSNSSNNNSSNNNTSTTDDIPDVTGWWSGTWKAYQNDPDPNTGPFLKDPNTGEIIIAATGELVLHITQQNALNDPTKPMEGTLKIKGWSPGSPDNPPEWSGETSENAITSGWISKDTQYIQCRIIYTEGEQDYHFFWLLGETKLNITDTHISGIFKINEGSQGYFMQGTFTTASFQP